MNSSELELIKTFIRIHPDSAAREVELQSPEIAKELMLTLPLTQSRIIVSHMLPPYAARLCEKLSVERVAAILTTFTTNQIASILRCLPKHNSDEILEALTDKTATLCRLLMSYSDDIVGAWMTADIVMIPKLCTIAEALERFVKTDGSILGNALPVVDDTNHLIGELSLRDLLRAKPDAPISYLIKDAPPAVLSRTSLLSVSRHHGWKTHDTFAVNNRNGEYIGLLSHSQLRRSLEQFNGKPSIKVREDVLGGFAEIYGGSLVALLGLVEGQVHEDEMLRGKL